MLRHREIRRQSLGRTALVGRHRTHAGMKADERAAADRNPRRRAGHHVVIAGAVVPLVVANRADDRQLVGDAGQPRHVLREVDAGHLGADGLELAANLGRRVGLGIERLEVRRPAVHPNQDATRRPFRWRAASARRPSQPQQVDQAAAGQHAQPQLQAIAARHSFAVSCAIAMSRRLILEHELGRVDQGPHQVFGRLPAVGLCVDECGGNVRRFRRPWASGCSRQVKLFDDLPRPCVAGGQFGRAAVVAGHLLVQARARSSGASACTTVVSAVRS